MDKLGKLDLGGVASLGVAAVVLLAGWIFTSSQVAATHEAKIAREAMTLTADGRMKVTVTAKAADAAPARPAVTATANASPAQAIPATGSPAPRT